jgi:glycosyltransferase involved in cell wall biosynthesis
MVLIEALMAKLPVIVSGDCGYAEWVQASGGGIVLPRPFDPLIYQQVLEHMITEDRKALQETIQHYLTTQPFIDWIHDFIPIIERHNSLRRDAQC